MRAVVQRVDRASVAVAGETVGEIGRGLLVLLGVGPTDGPAEVGWIADKLAGLRIFPDDDGKMNRSVREIDGEVLVVSQFTLFGDIRKGRRPSFVGAGAPELARPLYEQVCDALAAQGIRKVARGRFAATMDVASVNHGPVTLIVDTAELRPTAPQPEGEAG
ncbi:MAG: D-aminoacyl-tRNA deacylase [Myxococcota bacterium]